MAIPQDSLDVSERVVNIGAQEVTTDGMGEHSCAYRRNADCQTVHDPNVSGLESDSALLEVQQHSFLCGIVLHSKTYVKFMCHNILHIFF